MNKSKFTKIKKKAGFPWAILLLMFFLLSLFSSISAAGYFYFMAQSGIFEYEQYTKNYTTNIVEALANVAELCYKARDYTRLKKMIHEKIHTESDMEAFFVLSDGKIIAHSHESLYKKLKGNIANDEFAYNIDYIFQPVKEKTHDVLFMDYNIVGKQIPFNRLERQLIKNYLYKGINTIGWLTTRAVYSPKKPIGTINIITGKEKIFSTILYTFIETVDLLVAFVITSFIISLFTSLIIYFRYRTPMKILSSVEVPPDGEIINATAEHSYADKYFNGYGETEKVIIASERSIGNTQKNIKDAIPIAEK